MMPGRGPVALALIVLLLSAFSPRCRADYGVHQKGYDAKQKGDYHHEHIPWHHRLYHPGPDVPLLQSVAVMRVAGPERRVRLRVEQESGAEPESAQEPCEKELAELKQRLTSLERRFDLLFDSVQRLVNQLQPEAQ